MREYGSGEPAKRSGRKSDSGRRLPIGTEFCYGGYEWTAPAACLCRDRLILDLCRKVEMKRLAAFYDKWSGADQEHLSAGERMRAELENPMEFSVDFLLEINGAEVSCKSWSGSGWHPPFAGDSGREAVPGRPDEEFSESGRPSGMAPQMNGEEWVKAYGLDRAFAWVFYRVKFPWPAGEVRNLSLTLKAQPESHPCGDPFTFGPGCPPLALPFSHPVHGNPCTLRLLTCERNTLSVKPEFPNRFQVLAWPEQYCTVSYLVEPELPAGETVRLMDCSESDPPLCLKKDGSKTGDRSCAVSIVGGADGPTAVFIAGKNERGGEREPNAECACSSLHFEPAEKVEWLTVLSATPFKPERFSLLGPENTGQRDSL